MSASREAVQQAIQRGEIEEGVAAALQASIAQAAKIRTSAPLTDVELATALSLIDAQKREDDEEWARSVEASIAASKINTYRITASTDDRGTCHFSVCLRIATLDKLTAAMQTEGKTETKRGTGESKSDNGNDPPFPFEFPCEAHMKQRMLDILHMCGLREFKGL
jgi:hypothetical protein